ncbi:hypothetical protein HD553DRAFT_342633 [Filobasidium floriforme]|uniref:uncharacterized protein n=1 Tax=Filobasidium floriforme TaxID=5210 RepID=UPI001E8D3D29|nr:uncharacterized protein HD553DRAFT_342633 [Filobasidium floriforme]KAH8084232.1 hypothetical protein HD553DRAFT_342633 [Filobasidium floriforme]
MPSIETSETGATDNSNPLAKSGSSGASSYISLSPRGPSTSGSIAAEQQGEGAERKKILPRSLLPNGHLFHFGWHIPKQNVSYLRNKKVGVMTNWWQRIKRSESSNREISVNVVSGQSAQTPTYETSESDHRNASTAPLSFGGWSRQLTTGRTIDEQPEPQIPIDINVLRATKLYRIGFHFVSIDLIDWPSDGKSNHKFRFIVATVPSASRYLSQQYRSNPHLVTDTETLPAKDYVIAFMHEGESLRGWTRELELHEGRTWLQSQLKKWAGYYPPMPHQDEFGITYDWIREAAGYDKARDIYPRD